MKYFLLLAIFSFSAFADECYRTVGTKAIFKNFRNSKTVVEKYEIKSDGRFPASFEPARNEDGEFIYESSGLEKINPEDKEHYFPTECPLGTTTKN